MSITESQQRQLEELQSGEMPYGDASIYTILLDLAKANGAEEVFIALHNVAHDLDKLYEIEELFEESKNWGW